MKQLKTIKNKKTCLPQGEITDWPAFRIRGFMHSKQTKRAHRYWYALF